MEAFAQALEYAQAAGEPVTEIVAAMAYGEIIKAEIIEDTGVGQLIVVTAEPERVEVTMRLESGMPAKKPTTRGKRGVAIADSVNK